MDITGEERISAKREIVWQALNSPNVLRKCIPNCESLEKKSPTQMLATVKFKVGPIPATFKADVTLANLNAPNSYTIVVDGQGGLAGSAKGTCDVALVQDGDETVLTYKVGAQMSGALAKLGAKMIDASAKKVATNFFKKFGKIAAKRAARMADKASKPAGDDDDDGDE
jgi:carbon monoxide dehydrogenase subunit G